ncbi:hypothetical protein OG429_20455 [Streptomyces sp. NBC_00190]|uniref:hypothetical protein n=1 Tax=unclassified Streptomyces TaxID=2593676 RepID=UPI002E2D0A95|nr:hypothetical protein [Streptomyces sp. NBC_00190]WSZ41440.1 hypothetical protein OG239_23235 [Streptomyces sp. NBC_00868]
MTSSRPQVIVHAPDGRGLREVGVAGETVGRAWSPRDLRRVLRRAGVPAAGCPARGARHPARP